MHKPKIWGAAAEDYQAVHGAELTTRPLAWGAWRVPEDELAVLGDTRGVDVLELGCGAAQWSIALAGLGGRPVGLDQSLVQLKHAVANRETAGAAAPPVAGRGGASPFPDPSLRVVFCDTAAFVFCTP